MKREKNNCKHCKSEFVLKRSDQKFCSNKCRSRFYNKNSIRNSEIVKSTNKLLLKDYKILVNRIKDRKEIKVVGGILKKKGFSFTSSTYYKKFEDLNQLYPVLYDLCYYEVDDVTFKILRV